MGHDRRTIKRFVANSQQGRKKRIDKKDAVGGRATPGLQGGVEEGWQRTGWAGGIGPDCEQVPAIRSNQGVCTYVPALCFSEGEESRVRERSGGPIRDRDRPRHYA